MAQRLMTVKAVCEKLDCSRNAFYNLRQTKGFPKPVKIDNLGMRWKATEIDRWIGRQKADK